MALNIHGRIILPSFSNSINRQTQQIDMLQPIEIFLVRYRTNDRIPSLPSKNPQQNRNGKPAISFTVQDGSRVFIFAAFPFLSLLHKPAARMCTRNPLQLTHTSSKSVIIQHDKRPRRPKHLQFLGPVRPSPTSPAWPKRLSSAEDGG